MSYRDDDIYQELERIIRDAGITIEYRCVPDDSIDGAIWARSDDEALCIIMPDDPEAFPSTEKACNILGHEMGHIITGLDSPDDPVKREENEKTCDQVGIYLTKLAEMTAGYKAEQRFLAACNEYEEQQRKEGE